MIKDLSTYRADFPIFSEAEGEKPLIYLDSAATTQKPEMVIDAISDFYRSAYANVHRSPHRLGEAATEKFEGARRKLAKFIGTDDEAEIIFTRGTTESINLIASILSQQVLQPGDVILTTPSEHHSNLVPWQMAAARTGAKLEFISLHENGVFDPDEIAENWNPATKVFAFQHASNVLGTIHPVSDLCRIARENGALTVVDGAQAIPHFTVDVGQFGCDFYAVSAHKMCGPSGIGAFWGRRDLLEGFDPVFGGGEMIRSVSLQKSAWNRLPFKFEPGTPNIAGVVGWGAAIEYLEDIGMDNVHQYVQMLAETAVEKLSQIEGLTIHGPAKGRTGAVSFSLSGVHPHDIASILDMEGIAVRAGLHCAEPLVRWLGEVATVRASFYIYNSSEDINFLVNGLKKVNVIFHK